jgi:hypothetical protein
MELSRCEDGTNKRTEPRRLTVPVALVSEPTQLNNGEFWKSGYREIRALMTINSGSSVVLRD